MRIAYITTKNPFDKKIWSGSTNFIYECLKDADCDVDVLGPIEDYFKFCLNILQIFFSLFGLKYDPDRSKLLSKYYSWKIKKKLKNKYDFIFIHESNLASYLRTKIPIILWTDITFSLYKDTYLKNISLNNKQGLKLEKLAYKNLSKIIYTSDWVIKDLKKKSFYNKKKFFKLPLGSNFPSKQIPYKKIKKSLKQINLLSIGIDWERKGFKKTILVNEEVNKLGVNSFLNIVGPNIENYDMNLKKVIIHKFLDKNHPIDSVKLKRLFLKSHYFILLSKVEAHGLVLIEASAFGLPKIVNNIGGMTSLVKNNKDGLIFNINESPKKIAKKIVENFYKKKRYKYYSKNSYQLYKNLLNKRSITNNLIKIMKS